MSEENAVAKFAKYLRKAAIVNEQLDQQVALTGQQLINEIKKFFREDKEAYADFQKS